MAQSTLAGGGTGQWGQRKPHGSHIGIKTQKYRPPILILYAPLHAHVFSRTCLPFCTSPVHSASHLTPLQPSGPEEGQVRDAQRFVPVQSLMHLVLTFIPHLRLIRRSEWRITTVYINNTSLRAARADARPQATRRVRHSRRHIAYARFWQPREIQGCASAPQTSQQPARRGSRGTAAGAELELHTAGVRLLPPSAVCR